MSVISKPEDIERLRHSGRILASCCYHMENLIKPGISAEKLNTFCTQFIRSYDAEPSFLNYSGFPHSLCFSNNDEVVHGLCTPEKILKPGDVLSVDLGVDYEGLFSDTAATYIVTKDGVDRSCKFHFIESWKETKPSVLDEAPSLELKRKRELLEATSKSLIRGISAVRHGAKTGDIGHAVGNFLASRGYGNVTQLGGHGLGYEVHCEPFISHVGRKGTGSLLVENMVIAIEPMVTLGKSGQVKFVKNSKYGWEEIKSKDGTLAAHFEHSMLVTKKGCEVFTRIQEKDVLPLKAEITELLQKQD